MDIVLFQADGHIEMRYYRMTYPGASATLTIGVSGSATDYAYLINDIIPNQSLVYALSGATVSFYPVHYTPGQASVTQLSATLSTPSTFNATITYGNQPSTPPTLPVSAQIVAMPGFNIRALVAIGYHITFYGVAYHSVSVSSNGYMQFVTNTTSSISTPTSLPSSTLTGPLIAFAWTYQYGYYATYQTITTGASMSQVFTFRLLNSEIYTTPYTSYVSVDILLYQADGHVEIRYYRFNPTTAAVTIGVQGSSSDYAAVLNNVAVSPSLASLLNGATIAFYPSSFVQSNNNFSVSTTGIVPFSQGTYNVTWVQSVTPPVAFTNAYNVGGQFGTETNIGLGFNFYFYNQTYSHVYVGGSGNLQFATQTSLFSSFSLPTASATTVPIIAFFANYFYSYYGSVTYEMFGTTGQHYGIVRFNSVELYSSPYSSFLSVDVVLYEADGRIEVRYYRIDPGTATSVTIGIQGAQQYNGLPDYATLFNNALLSDAVDAALVGSTVFFTPTNFRNVSTFFPPSATYTQQLINSVIPLVNLTNSIVSNASNNDDGCQVAVPIGFNFSFYGQTYAALDLCSNGNIQFAAAPNPATSVGTLPLSPASYTSFLPSIMFFMADMYPNVPSVQKLYAVNGNAPFRTFTYRFYGVGYKSNNNPSPNITAPGVTCDVVLFETYNRIEVRYYSVVGDSHQVTIGLQSANLLSNGAYDYNAFINYATLSPIAAAAVNGTTLSWIPSNSALSSITSSYAPNNLAWTNPESSPPYTGTYDMGCAAQALNAPMAAGQTEPYLYLLGGGIATDGHFNVWRSVDGGSTANGWQQLIDTSALPELVQPVGGVLANGIQLVFAGSSSNTVYYSADNWNTYYSYNAPFSPRSVAAAAVIPGTNSILMCTGLAVSTPTNDCWLGTHTLTTVVTSNWTQQSSGSASFAINSATAAYPGPTGYAPFTNSFFGSAMVSMYDSTNTILVIGGKDNINLIYTNTVWISYNRGVSWTNGSQALFNPRALLMATVDLDNIVYVVGGETNTGSLNAFNDAWYSPDKGQTWIGLNSNGQLSTIYAGCLAIRYLYSNINAATGAATITKMLVTYGGNNGLLSVDLGVYQGIISPNTTGFIVPPPSGSSSSGVSVGSSSVGSTSFGSSSVSSSLHSSSISSSISSSPVSSSISSSPISSSVISSSVSSSLSSSLISSSVSSSHSSSPGSSSVSSSFSSSLSSSVSSSFSSSLSSSVSSSASSSFSSSQHSSSLSSSVLSSSSHSSSVSSNGASLSSSISPSSSPHTGLSSSSTAGTIPTFSSSSSSQNVYSVGCSDVLGASSYTKTLPLAISVLQLSHFTPSFGSQLKAAVVGVVQLGATTQDVLCGSVVGVDGAIGELSTDPPVSTATFALSNSVLSSAWDAAIANPQSLFYTSSFFTNNVAFQSCNGTYYVNGHCPSSGGGTSSGGAGGGGGSGLSGGAIAGIVIGVVVGICLLFVAIALCFLRGRKTEGTPVIGGQQNAYTQEASEFTKPEHSQAVHSQVEMAHYDKSDESKIDLQHTHNEEHVQTQTNANDAEGENIENETAMI